MTADEAFAMIEKLSSVFTTCGLGVLLLAWNSSTTAAETYEDAEGRFAIDLPAGYTDRMTHQSDGFNFVGSGDTPPIIIAFLEDEMDTEAGFAESVEITRRQLESAKLQSRIRMTVNGHPAIWGRFKGETTIGGQRAPLYSMAGAITLESGTLYYLSVFNDYASEKWTRKLRTVFETIREIEEPVTGREQARSLDSN